jgi:hypothetical protein
MPNNRAVTKELHGLSLKLHLVPAFERLQISQEIRRQTVRSDGNYKSQLTEMGFTGHRSSSLEQGSSIESLIHMFHLLLFSPTTVHSM